jgi:outer membrane protein assembly factor BamA
MLSRRLSLALAFAFALSAAAQTYTPRTIRFTGAPGQDSAQLLALTGWKTGAPITQQEILAGLQKLADTGSFTDINWHVDNAALVITLTASPESSGLPVRLTNFAWWTSTGLEQNLEAAVPGYRGTLPQAGTLLTQVEAALTSMLQQKGVTATISSIAGRDPRPHGAKVLALSIDHPSILVGNVALPDAKPAFGPSIADFQRGLLLQDFDVDMTSSTIQQDAAAIYANAGYLDAAIDAPLFSTPRATASGYAVDATATPHLGELYHVAAVNFPNPPQPLSSDGLLKQIELKPGQLASPMAVQLSAGEAARAYHQLGYLDAQATPSTSIDNLAHTASYTFTIDRGELYHIASVDLSAAPAIAQSLAHNSILAPGAVATSQVEATIVLALHNQHLDHTLHTDIHPDRATHTVTIRLISAARHPTQ